jgi:glyoxylase-like metal-dependent hydrolase (beta-lactamase superfamily II)
MKVTDGVYRGFENIINFYLIEEGGRLTLVDAGIKGNWDVLQRALAEAGKTPADVEAVLITHAHPDHTGLAERLRKDHGSRVQVHAADHGFLLGEGRPPQGNFLTALRHPAVLKMLWYFVTNGALRNVAVAEAGSFKDGEVLDVPGRPRVVHTPGHTPGSSSLLFEERGVLCTGDALLTIDWLSGERGPVAPPALSNADTAQAIQSLDRLEALSASLLLPGHGEPWRGTPAEAVQAARARLQAG